jgi:GNAT superfamily N-acetyltransferase
MRAGGHCDWVIAPLLAEERAACHAIMNEAWASIPGAPSRHLDREQFEQQTAGEEIWTARDAGGAIIGFVSLWRAECFIHHLYVAPQHQGRGAGAALLAHAIATLGGTASLKCSDMNRGARRFYEAAGGRPTQTGKDETGPWTRLEFGSAS